MAKSYVTIYCDLIRDPLRFYINTSVFLRSDRSIKFSRLSRFDEMRVQVRNRTQPLCVACIPQRSFDVNKRLLQVTGELLLNVYNKKVVVVIAKYIHRLTTKYERPFFFIKLPQMSWSYNIR